jgi:hypothetical protein
VKTPKRRKLTRLIVRGGPAAVAKFCVNEPSYCKAMVPSLARKLMNEIKKLCSDECNSIQRKADASLLLQSFTWDQVVTEAKVHAPLLHGLLENIFTKHDQPPNTPLIGFILPIF